MGTNLVLFTLQRIGSSLLFDAELVPEGPRGFVMQGLQMQRLSRESDVLKKLELAGIGHWSSFPPDNIQATVTRNQLRAMGFKGNY